MFLRVFRFGFLVGRQDFFVFYRNWKIWVVAWLLGSFSGAARYVLLGELIGSREVLQYLLIGNAVAEGARSVSWVCAASTWDRWAGTYPLLVISPSGLVPAVAGRVFVWFLNGVATSLVTFALLMGAFGLHLPVTGALLLPVAVGLVCGSTYCFMLFLGAFINLVPRLRNVFLSLSATILTTFCGPAVPIDFWSPWIRAVVSILPVTHGMQAIRLLLTEGPATGILQGLTLEAVLGAAWLCCAFFVMDRIADKGRVNGTIDFVGI